MFLLIDFQDVQATTMSAFIVDDVDDDNFEDAEEDESNEEDDLFDSVCAICDNGGDLLWYVRFAGCFPKLDCGFITTDIFCFNFFLVLSFKLLVPVSYTIFLAFL